MTKSQLREKYITWNKNTTKLHEVNNSLFREMQGLARECNKTVYCSMDSLLNELIETSTKDKAFNLYKEYYSNEGEIKALEKFMILTDNFKI